MTYSPKITQIFALSVLFWFFLHKNRLLLSRINLASAVARVITQLRFS